MDRRLFLHFPLLASGITKPTTAKAINRPNKGFKVGVGKDRNGQTINFLGNLIQCKVSAKDTDGDLCIFHNTIVTGPYLHFHHAQDEWFFVLKGKFQFKVGEETYLAEEGDSVFGPRMVPHAFANIGGVGILMAVFQPGLQIEAFYREGSLLKSPTPQQIRVMSLKYGVEVVGPPLQIT